MTMQPGATRPVPDTTLPANGLSYVKGDTTSPLSEQTIPALLASTVARHGQRPAVVFREQGIRWTWQEFAAAVDAMAAGLHTLGLRRGDRVGIWSPNRAEWLLTQFATARVGLVMVNINPAYRLSELEYALNKVGCKAVIAPESFKTSRYLDMLQTLAPELEQCEPGALQAARLPELRWVIRMEDKPTPGMLTWQELLARGAGVPVAELDAITAQLDRKDPINVQFTSGTTGAPKGATLTHRNIVNNARYIAAAMRFTEQDKLCIPVPLYHCFGMVLAVLACVPLARAWSSRARPLNRWLPCRPSAKSAAPPCTACRPCSSPSSTTPSSAALTLSTLRTGIMAGSPCPIEVMKRVVADMHMAEVTIAYGMTETSPVSFQSSTDDPLDKRVATVGRVQPHLECKVVDATGHIVPVGRDRRAAHARLLRHARLLGRRSAHQRSDPRRLDAYRRPGDDRRGGLLQYRRPRQGHADPRR
ncbi:AMP-binding protein [Cupriavidus basilensis]